MKKIHLGKDFWLILLVIIILASLFPLMDGSHDWLRGWFAYLALQGLGAASIFGIRRVVKASQSATLIAIVAFCLRLATGITLALLLPVVGYPDNLEHRSGYVYTDAYIRDGQSWDLAISSAPLSESFSGKYSGDQYGGMLAISALVYRFLSPDAHRPFLILILNATLSAWGVLCLWKASSTWFAAKTALLATWFFALYPESILLGSSQMREALVIPMTAVSFFGLTELQTGKRSGLYWLVLSAIILFSVQPLAGFGSFVVLMGIWILDPLTLQAPKRRQTVMIVLLLVTILLIAMLMVSSVLTNLPSLQGSKLSGAFLTWFTNNFQYQSYITELRSGMFQSLLNTVGEQWRWLIVLVYGIAQPVLPAIVGDPGAAWIMRIIGLLRASGWYVLALFLVYGTLGAFRSRGEVYRLRLIWICIISWVWILVAALNAGADQWDNPRYRVILLVWQVILAAWAWDWARSRKDAWLWRWLAIELVFVGMFTEWYLGRYYPGFPHLSIKWMTLITLLVCGLILIGGVIWDKKHRLDRPSTNNRL